MPNVNLSWPYTPENIEWRRYARKWLWSSYALLLGYGVAFVAGNHLFARWIPLRIGDHGISTYLVWQISSLALIACVSCAYLIKGFAFYSRCKAHVILTTGSIFALLACWALLIPGGLYIFLFSHRPLGIGRAVTDLTLLLFFATMLMGSAVAIFVLSRWLINRWRVI